jgi:inhibitor of cysteine peptidase
LSILVLTEEDSGREVSVELGDEVRVSLAENPTTGYRWMLASMTPGILELEDASFSPAPGAGVGGGGRRRFSFKARAPGRASLELHRRTPWASDEAPTAQFGWIVTVRKGT